MPQPAKHLEPRWHAMVAIFAVGGLRLALPHELSVGPDWLLLAVIGALIAIYTLTRQFAKHKFAAFFGYLMIAIVTADMTWSLCRWKMGSAAPARRGRHGAGGDPGAAPEHNFARNTLPVSIDRIGRLQVDIIAT